MGLGQMWEDEEGAVPLPRIVLIFFNFWFDVDSFRHSLPSMRRNTSGFMGCEP